MCNPPFGNLCAIRKVRDPRRDNSQYTGETANGCLRAEISAGDHPQLAVTTLVLRISKLLRLNFKFSDDKAKNNKQVQEPINVYMITRVCVPSIKAFVSEGVRPHLSHS